MKEKLIKFYFDCLLPELIDPRIPRSLPIRNPEYIIQAQKIKENTKKKNNNNPIVSTHTTSVFCRNLFAEMNY